MKKYFNTRREACNAKQERDPQGLKDLHVYKMPKGTRKAGKFAVCSYIEYLNTY